MICFTGNRIDATSNDAFYEDRVRHVEENESVGRNAGVGECFRLRERARETIEEPSRLGTVGTI